MTASEFKPLPNDKLAEQMVLSTMMASAQAAEEAMKLLTGSDFWAPAHRTIFETIASLAEEHQPTDPIAVRSRMINQNTIGQISASYLAELFGMPAMPGQVIYFAAQVAELATRRGYAQVAMGLHQRATGGESSLEIGNWVRDAIARVEVGTGVASEADAFTMSTMPVETPPSAWVVPGMLQRGERLILTGEEGLGKSTLSRQFAVCSAASVHPFTGARQAERPTVLVVDAENPEIMARQEFAKLGAKLAANGMDVPDDRLYLRCRPDGVDLTQRSGVSWLLRQVERYNPDLIVIGPLYQLHLGDPNDERDARRVSAALNQARNLHGAALLIEAHSPHTGTQKRRPIRPIGSSLWLRWPEFGYGLRMQDDAAAWSCRAADFAQWRGPRAERNWPKKLRSGTVMPWILDEAHRTWQP